MSALKERLEQLQCHFTWDFEEHDQLDIGHVHQTLAVRIKHTPYHNHATFYGLQAYVYQRQGRYQDALQSLGEAEEVLREHHQANFAWSMLVTYGNYAWIYYHLSDYDRVERYLCIIHDINRSPSHSSQSVSLIPEINGVKGWSLLAVGFRNGEQAAACFREALAEDSENREFRAGLAIALYAMARRNNAASELKKEAKAKLQELVHEEPINYEVRVCLARLLKNSDWVQAQELAEDVVQNSLDPEVLRNAAQVFIPKDLKRHVDILKHSIVVDPSYSLLHRDIGYHYQNQLKTAEAGMQQDILSAAIESCKQAIHMVPACVLAKISLAEMYGRNNQQSFQQEMYVNLERELPNVSQICQQAVYLSYGKFLLYGMNLLDNAANVFVKGFKLSSTTKEGKQCRSKLLKISTWFQEQGKIVEANDILQLMQESQHPQV